MTLCILMELAVEMYIMLTLPRQQLNMEEVLICINSKQHEQQISEMGSFRK